VTADSIANFFVICQPGLESALSDEIREVWPWLLAEDARAHAEPQPELKMLVGGVDFQASVHLGLQLNFFLRLASRILLRLSEFKAKDFTRLYQKLERVHLASTVGQAPFMLHIAASQSKLNNEKRILKVIQDRWAQQVVPSAPQALYVRAFDDQFTVSVDTSGRHLHFRNSEATPKSIGEAPLRETLAAFALRNLQGTVSLGELQTVTLWDPMAGSGSFLWEAFHGLAGNWQREYSFQNFTLTKKLWRSSLIQGNYQNVLRTASSHFGNLVASDVQTHLLQKQKDLPFSVHQADIRNRDFRPPGRRLWILANPPYNQRLQLGFSIQTLGEEMALKKAERVSVILPPHLINDWFAGYRGVQSQAQVLGRFPFRNGGLPVEQILVS